MLRGTLVDTGESLRRGNRDDYAQRPQARGADQDEPRGIRFAPLSQMAQPFVDEIRPG
jgi:hypothetical protein